jgi:hypothetical protein
MAEISNELGCSTERAKYEPVFSVDPKQVRVLAQRTWTIEQQFCPGEIDPNTVKVLDAAGNLHPLLPQTPT